METVSKPIYFNNGELQSRRLEKGMVLLTAFASWLSMPGMDVTTLRKLSIPCTDRFLFHKPEEKNKNGCSPKKETQQQSSVINNEQK